MTTVLLLLNLCTTAAEPDAHEKSNPLYLHLRQKGVSISDTKRVPMPAPRMVDGLAAKAQTALIKELIGDDFDYDNFVDASVNAPYMLLPLSEIKGGSPDAPIRALNFYFVAHGKLETLTKKEVLDRIGTSDRKKDKGKTLTAEDLKQRGLAIAPDMEKREGYGYGSNIVLDKVEVRSTGHSIWSETLDSIVLAAEIDPRFTDDKEFPNRWMSLEKQDDGEFKTGPPHPYQSAGYYMRATRLNEPAGALFIECHVIFTEPTGWFGGENLLRSKLPPVVQDEVRKIRRELIKDSKQD